MVYSVTVHVIYFTNDNSTYLSLIWIIFPRQPTCLVGNVEFISLCLYCLSYLIIFLHFLSLLSYDHILLYSLISRLNCHILFSSFISCLYCYILLYSFISCLYCHILFSSFISCLYCHILFSSFISCLYCHILFSSFTSCLCCFIHFLPVDLNSYDALNVLFLSCIELHLSFSISVLLSLFTVFLPPLLWQSSSLSTYLN